MLKDRESKSVDVLQAMPMYFEQYQESGIEDIRFLLKGNGYQAYFAPNKVILYLEYTENGDESSELVYHTDLNQRIDNEESKNSEINHVEITSKEDIDITKNIHNALNNYSNPLQVINDSRRNSYNRNSYNRNSYNRNSYYRKGYSSKGYDRERCNRKEYFNVKTISKDIIEIKFEGSDNKTEIIGKDKLTGKINYFIGSDPSNWKLDVPSYNKILYKEIYPGIDILFFVQNGKLEFDYILREGADPENIKLTVHGSDHQDFDQEGNFQIYVNSSMLKIYKPYVYQIINGLKKKINCNYRKDDIAGTINFQLGKYDTTKVLNIDPVIMYSNYMNILAGTTRVAFDVDEEGNYYLTGDVGSQPNMYVLKFNKNNTIIYRNEFGGTRETYSDDIAVDKAGNMYILGETNSNDFPTKNAFQNQHKQDKEGETYDNFDLVIIKMDQSGSVLYSTYLGGEGDDYGYGITTDDEGNAYITGESGSSPFNTETNPNGFPYDEAETLNPLEDGDSCIYVVKINSTGSELTYSKQLNGSGRDRAMAIALDRESNAYITGSTESEDFPLINAYQTNYKDGKNAFVARLDESGVIDYSTIFGGNGEDVGTSIKVDIDKNVYFCGSTESKDFPLKNSYQSRLRGGRDAFISKLNLDNNELIFSTYLGGSGNECVNFDFSIALDIDEKGYVYVTGDTDSTDFPLVHPISHTVLNDVNTFVVKLSRLGNKLIYSTLIGGSSGDSGIAIRVLKDLTYIAGITYSSDFPVVNASPDNIDMNETSIFIVKLQSRYGLAIESKVLEHVNLGSLLSYQYIITNIQSDTVVDGVFIDYLPQNASLVSVTLSKGTYEYDGSRIVCNLGEIDLDDIIYINITILPEKVGVITNRVTLYYQGSTIEDIKKTLVSDIFNELKEENRALRKLYVKLSHDIRFLLRRFFR